MFVRNVCLSIGLTVLTIQFCGCTSSQDDIRKFAIKRPKDDDSPSMPAAAQISPDATKQSAVEPTPPSLTAAAPTTPPAANVPDLRGSGAASSVAQPPLTSASPLASETSGPLADTQALDRSLSATDQRRRTIEHMTRIAKAMDAYLTKQGSYPPACLASSTGSPLLSWRVALLPYLGYESLYRSFHLNEPWNSPHNQLFLTQIPSVYQSPERCDQRTNYLVPVSGVTAFNGAQARAPHRWEDGKDNCILVVEANNAAAVPWTAPQDLAYSSPSPRFSLFELREDGVFAAFGGGQVLVVPKTLNDAQLRALFTVDGGEALPVGSLCQLAVAETKSAVDGVNPSAAADGDVVGVTMADKPLAVAPSNATGVNAPAVSGSGHVTPADDTLAHLAQLAHEQHVDLSATRLALAAYLLDESQAAANFRWVPALRRPASFVRFALGINYVGEHSETIRREFGSVDVESPVAPGRFDDVIGDASGPLLHTLGQFDPIEPPMFDASDRPQRKAAARTPIYFVGIADTNLATRVALKHQCDVLLMFQVQEHRTRTGIDVKTVEFSVHDVWSSRELLRTTAINYRKRQLDQTSPLFEDPIDAVVARFAEFLQNDLRPQTFPASIRAQHVKRRVDQLAKSPHPNRLAAMAEIKFYRDAGLLDAEPMMAAMQALLGSGPAIAYLTGRGDERHRALEPWLPSPPLTDDRQATVTASRTKADPDP